MYKRSRLTINTESVRARIAFLSRVWNAVENDIGSQSDRKYQEAYILATRMIPGRAAVGFGSFDPTTLMPSHEEASPSPLTLGTDSSSDYSCESNQPRTPSEGEYSLSGVDSDSTSYYTYESSQTDTPTDQQPNLDDEVMSILGGSNLGAFMFDRGNADLQMGLESFMFPDFGVFPPQPLPSEVEYLSHPVPATLDLTDVSSKKREYDDMEDAQAAVSRNVKKPRKEDKKDLEEVDDAPQ